MRPHLFYERCHGKCIVTSTAGKQYEKYFLFRWTASEMSDALQQEYNRMKQITKVTMAFFPSAVDIVWRKRKLT